MHSSSGFVIFDYLNAFLCIRMLSLALLLDGDANNHIMQAKQSATRNHSPVQDVFLTLSARFFSCFLLECMHASLHTQALFFTLDPFLTCREAKEMIASKILFSCFIVDVPHSSLSIPSR